MDRNVLRPDWREFLQQDLKPGRMNLHGQVVRHVVKRDGKTESYNREKIAIAIRGAFDAVGKAYSDEQIEMLIVAVEHRLSDFMGGNDLLDNCIKFFAYSFKHLILVVIPYNIFIGWNIYFLLLITF